jgi:hypothetical protein
MTFALLGGFERGNSFWFAVCHRDHAFALGAPEVLDAWIRKRHGRPECVRRGRRWALVTPTPPEKV